MRRFTVSLSLALVVLLGLAASGMRTLAQDATPAVTPVAPGETVSLNGADIYYEVSGAGKPLVLVHGALGSGLDFVNQIPAFVAAGYQVIAIDNRGHGRSSHGPEPLSFELMASDVVGVMDHLGIEKADVVGWSWGATTGLVLAMTYPERLHKVVVYGGQFRPGVVEQATPDPEFDAFISDLFETAIADYQRLSPHPERLEALFEEIGALDAVAPNFREEQLQSITVPVLILDGAEEEAVPHDQPGRMAALIPGAELVIMPDVGHFAPIQQPEEFNRIVLEFLHA